MRASYPPLPEVLPGVPSEDPVVTTAIVSAAARAGAFFSSTAASLISYDKVRMRHLAESGTPTARIVNPINAQHSPLFAPIRLSKNNVLSRATSVAHAYPVSHWDARRALAAALAMAGWAGSFRTRDDKTVLVEAPRPRDEADDNPRRIRVQGDHETLAGFVLNQLGCGPRVGETLRRETLCIRVAARQGLWIKRLELNRG